MRALLLATTAIFLTASLPAAALVPGGYTGAVAPIGAQVGQMWNDTSAGAQQPVVRMWDGAQWVAQGALNGATHLFNSTPGQLLLRGPSGCKSTTGAYDFVQGGQSWLLGCSGTFLADSPQFTVYPPQGTDGLPTTPMTPNPTSNPLAQLVVQTRVENTGRNQVGAFITGDNGLNYGTNSAGNLYGYSALNVAVRTHGQPGSDCANNPIPSMCPGTTWLMNLDGRMEPTAGARFFTIAELDLEMENPNPGFSGWLWLNGLVGNTAGFGIAMQSCCNSAFTGTANVSGTALTSVTAQIPFTASTTTITINGTIYRATFVDGTHLTLAKSAGTLTGVSFAWQTHLMAYGLLIDGLGEVFDSALKINDGSNQALNIGGAHIIDINTSGDVTAPYAMITGAGQSICLNGYDACALYAGGNLTSFTQNGGTTLQLQGSASATYFPRLTNSTNNNVALTAVGPSGLPANLILTGQLSGVVQVSSNMIALGTIAVGSNGMMLGDGVAKGIYSDSVNVAIRATATTGSIYFQGAGGGAVYAQASPLGLTIPALTAAAPSGAKGGNVCYDTNKVLYGC